MGMRDTSTKREYCDSWGKLICKINPNKWCNLHQKFNKQFRDIMNILKLSVKWKKHSTKTLSLVIHKVRLKKKRAKKYISIQRGMKPSNLVVNWISSYLSFFLSTSTVATYIFTNPNRTIIIISLEPCALNVEFQHFIVSYSISYETYQNVFILLIPLKKGIRRWKEVWRQGEDKATLRITLFKPIFNYIKKRL